MLLGQRRDPLLSAFADRPDVRAGAQLRVGAGEAEQLGDAQPGLDGGEQQRVVAPAGPCRSVRGVEQRLRLGRREERDGAFLGAFARDREHALGQRGVLGVPQRAVVKERVDRGEPDVAGAGGVPALLLEVLKKRADRRRVEVGDLQL